MPASTTMTPAPAARSRSARNARSGPLVSSVPTDTTAAMLGSPPPIAASGVPCRVMTQETHFRGQAVRSAWMAWRQDRLSRVTAAYMSKSAYAWVARICPAYPRERHCRVYQNRQDRSVLPVSASRAVRDGTGVPARSAW